MTAAQRASAGYEPSDYFDETFFPNGELRPAYEELFAGIAPLELETIRSRVRTRLDQADVRFGPGEDSSPFVVDPLPRVITGAEWAELAAGLAQRVRALQRFLADIYGPREIFAAGVMRRSILDGAPHYEPVAAGFPGPVVADLAGPDLVRDETGFQVLEDNLRFPSGLAFALAARRSLADEWRTAPPPIDGEPAIAELGRMLRSRDPRGTGDPEVALLGEGAESAASYEHRTLASLLGIRVVTPADLELSGSRLAAREQGELRPVDVLYNRSDIDRITTEDGRPTALGEILIEPLRAGNLTCVNSFGAGIADDKAVHCYTTEMIRFYLEEEPLLEIPESFDLGEPEQAEQAMERLDELVIKPRWELGGQDIVIGPKAGNQELKTVREAVRNDPGRHVAQRTVKLSTHPTLADGILEPRHVDLRPYVITTGGQPAAAPLALSRYARDRGDLVVSSTQGGGAKDTWILVNRTSTE